MNVLFCATVQNHGNASAGVDTNRAVRRVLPMAVLLIVPLFAGKRVQAHLAKKNNNFPLSPWSRRTGLGRACGYRLLAAGGQARWYFGQVEVATVQLGASEGKLAQDSKAAGIRPW